jgi:hypothetical protein
MNTIKMNTINYQSVGVKGSDVYSSTGDVRVDLSVMLVRGASKEDIRAGLEKILAMKDSQAFEDAFVMMFQTRNIRGGKGERDVFYEMFTYLYEREPVLVGTVLLDLIPKYGYWGDLVFLARDAPTEVRHLIADLFATQLRGEDKGEKSLSLCAKWSPREGKGGVHEEKQFNLVKDIANRLFPEMKLTDRLRAYRKLVSGLNKRLDTTEIKMCSGDWDIIEPKKVPGRNLALHKSAFLNETKHGVLRHVENEKRMTCRVNFQEYFDQASRGLLKIKAADVIYPHEVIAKVLKIVNQEERNSAKYHNSCYDSDNCYDVEDRYNCGCLSAPYDCEHAEGSYKDEKNLLRGQWRAIVEKAKESATLKNSIAMCDFSGSMNGMPKLICTALGLLVSEVNGTNKILTFDSTPKWMTFPEGDIFAKVAAINPSLGQGLSTDFQAAMDLILKDVAADRLTQDQIPKDLLVFTDMGFDQACGSNSYGAYTGNYYRRNVKTKPWQTHLEMIRESWRRLGEDMHGTPFTPPRIVVWNLRADYKDFHATSDQEGVVMLAGWSPSLFKVLQAKGVEVATPYDALRAQLDDEMYDPIRQRIRSWLSSKIV